MTSPIGKLRIGLSNSNDLRLYFRHIYEVFGTTLLRILCVLENFRRKFANLVAPTTDGTTKRLARGKAHQIL